MELGGPGEGGHKGSGQEEVNQESMTGLVDCPRQWTGGEGL